MYRFVLSRRWIGFALFVVVLGGVCVRLGVWQFHRLDERKTENAYVATNLTADPIPIGQVDSVANDTARTTQWRRVTITGTYDPDHQVVVRYQTRDGGPGADVVTPLVTSSGDAVLIDRGWVPTSNDASELPEVPAATPGQVTVTGWLRSNMRVNADDTVPNEGSVRAIASTGYAELVPYDLYGGYVQLLEQDPEPASSLVGPEDPDLGNGPHFFYALQWIFFAGLAVFGWFYFAWTEAHPDRRRTSIRHDTAAPTPASK